ncbi:MAG: hypothetical protein GEV03_10690 [Streptosporangiales bacterium]|nr:hypothetical protein [Streptosporangiales bacterium]
MRPRHPVKELERLLREAELRGWRAEGGRNYFRLRCPCGNHQRWVLVTPSDPDYEWRAWGWLRQTGCW